MRRIAALVVSFAMLTGVGVTASFSRFGHATQQTPLKLQAGAFEDWMDELGLEPFGDATTEDVLEFWGL